jgi:hypothetical protein
MVFAGRGWTRGGAAAYVAGRAYVLTLTIGRRGIRRTGGQAE